MVDLSNDRIEKCPRMVRTHYFEDRAEAIYAGLDPRTSHSYAGQEATGAWVRAHIATLTL
jgi:TPP-dependent pyruvate/acetoin dehydrogenase alpha subunit